MVIFLPARINAQFTGASPYQYALENTWYNPAVNTLASLSGTYYASPYSSPANLNSFILLHYNQDQLKDDILKKLNKENHFGLGMDNSLILWPLLPLKISGKQYGIGLNIREVYFQDMDFTDDFFKLMYQGNVPFAGSTASLSPLNFLTNSYLEAGLNFISNSGTATKYSVGLSYVMGSRFYSFNASSAELFTSVDGDSLHANINLDYKSSNPSKNQFFSFNGSGCAASFYLHHNFTANKSLTFAVDDVGFINWNRNSVSFKFDSSLSYTGFDIFSENSFSSGQSNFLDTFLNITENPSAEPFLLWLRPAVNLSFQYKINKKGSQLETGIKYTLAANSFPGSYLCFKYQPYGNFYCRGGVTYDEFQNPGANLELGIRLYQHVIVRVGTWHLEQFFVPFNGQSLYCNVSAVMGK